MPPEYETFELPACCCGNHEGGHCCPGWLHVDDPHEIERCDDCAKFPNDNAAQEAHRTGCGCDWPEVADRTEDGEPCTCTACRELDAADDATDDV